MLKVGIIGCGKIADQHAEQIRRVKGSELVAVCDHEELMSRQLAERFKIGRAYSNVDDFLRSAKPDVVHITTPPQSHFSLARKCLEAGCHVYVEKPFTTNADEAITLLEVAKRTDRKVTVGHNIQFSPEMLAMRQAVREGFLGGAPLHIDTVFSYDLGDANYVKALLGDSTHWVRQLPGQLLHNIISHGIAKIAEFMTCDRPLVSTLGFTSQALVDVGERNLVDELRVIISDRRNTTAYFTFTTQFVPPVQELRIVGPAGTLVVDNQHRTLVRLTRSSSQYRSYVNFFLPPWKVGGQLMRNAGANVARFIKADFHMDAGLKNLIEAFYKAVEGTGPMPFSYQEMLLTVQVMDEIFAQLPRLGSAENVRDAESAVGARVY